MLLLSDNGSIASSHYVYCWVSDKCCMKFQKKINVRWRRSITYRLKKKRVYLILTVNRYYWYHF